MKILRRKILRKVQQDIPWLEHIISDERIAGDLNLSAPNLEVQVREGSLCLFCRGSRMLCGKTRCPSLIRLYSFMKIKNMIDNDRILGSSPPGVFVGRIGYPYVYAGPLIPPILGDTSILDMPEKWIGRSIDEIINFRIGLIRGKFKVNVKKPLDNEHFLSRTLEIALSSESVDIEAIFKKKPSGRILFDDEVQPMGPSAPLLKIEVENAKIDSRIEKAYNDDDLKAEEAILNLYFDNVPVSRIQRAFSVGAFGIKKQRRMVPTRWSITAVDSAISRRLIEEVKDKPEISDYRVYRFDYLGNRFAILLIPSKWKYEWIEAWYPGTLWNPWNEGVAMGSDWEGYFGRTTYASLGGCYYAVRLAAAEFLSREGRQAGVIAMREIHPSFIMPLGVWINRECVREAFRCGCERFDTLEDALNHIKSIFSIPIREWIRTSALLKDELFQEKIIKYLSQL
ncbi:MAG: Nre family DNA repair protein [Candidatus Bathyarchaeia archaeon]